MAFHLRRQQRDLDLSTFTPIHAGRKKRQLSQMSSPASSQASSPHSKMSKRSKHSERPLARIEMLPAELLSQIFSYTCNLALPQASKELGEKLSNEAVYRAYFLRLFSQVDRYKMEDIRMNGYQGRVDAIDPCVVDEIAETQSYKSKILLCKWMTATRFERYRAIVLASVRDVPNTERVELYMDDDDKATYKSGLNLSLPTTLLRYRPQSGGAIPDRGFELLRILLRYYLVRLDPLGDGHERARDLFYQALLKEDYQLVYLIVRNELHQSSWITEIRVAIEHSENALKMFNLVSLMFAHGYFLRLFSRDQPYFSWPFFLDELRNLRDSVEDEFPGVCDPVPCFSTETAEEFRQALARTGESYWREQADVVTHYLKTCAREYIPNWLAAGRELRELSYR